MCILFLEIFSLGFSLFIRFALDDIHVCLIGSDDHGADGLFWHFGLTMNGNDYLRHRDLLVKGLTGREMTSVDAWAA